ncbi:MAG: class II aldolase/adducin family protein, partial [Spirochaetaceae bacterium]
LRPSSDTPTHTELYRAFSRIGGVVHTHSHYAVVYAQARVPVPAQGTTHADHFRYDVPVTRVLTEEEVAGDYEAATGRVIVERFRRGVSDGAAAGRRGAAGADARRAEEGARAGGAGREIGDAASAAASAAASGGVPWGVDPEEVPGVLVANHGPFTWGPTAHAAAENAIVLEEVCRMAYHTLTLNPEAGSAPQHLMDRHFLRKHGPGAYYGQTGR